jgi:hypothetical protein
MPRGPRGWRCAPFDEATTTSLRTQTPLLVIARARTARGCFEMGRGLRSQSTRAVDFFRNEWLLPHGRSLRVHQPAHAEPVLRSPACGNPTVRKPQKLEPRIIWRWGAKDGHATGGRFFFAGMHMAVERLRAHEVRSARSSIRGSTSAWKHAGGCTGDSRPTSNTFTPTHSAFLYRISTVFLLWQLHPTPPLFRVRRRCSAACNNWRGE